MKILDFYNHNRILL